MEQTKTHYRKRISIHALREEGDMAMLSACVASGIFLSTPSARRATIPEYYWRKLEAISIHALREEGDPDRYDASDNTCKFLSTPSARRATRITSRWNKFVGISIHALREEGDSKNRDKISIFKQIIQHSARI